jgi:glucosylceramidase
MEEFMYKRFAAAAFLICCTLSIAALQAATVTWRSSTNGAFWVDRGTLTTTAWDNDVTSYISVNETQTDQEIHDWGGCVCERPWHGIMKLSQANQDSVVKALFDTVQGILTNARCPVGMNDMAIGTYVCDDSFTVDYNMDRFSIAEDRKYLIPQLKAAMKFNPRLRVWCSPWTPPPWMKTRLSYYGGRMRPEAQYRNALALYLEKWIQAYRAEGINIFAIYHQNEPEHENDNWLVTHYEPADYLDFLRNYLYPKFRQDDMHMECGVGTCVQDDNPPVLIPTVLNDTLGNSYCTNIAIQYSIPNASYCRSTWPKKLLWMSETPAGNGSNDWTYAVENWNAMRDYLTNGVNSYDQWDIADVRGGTSNEGKPFSAPIVVDTVAKTYTLTPAYWQIKQITYYVKPGALRIRTTGNYTNHVAFRNRNGQNAVIVANTTGSSATVAFNLNGQKIKPALAANSFNSFSIAGTPVPDISPFNQIEAENYTGQSGAYTIPCNEGGSCLSYIHNNEWAFYYHLDFGTGANSFQARVAGTAGGSIEIRLDSVTATPVGTCTVPSTGSATTWQTVSYNLPTTISGKHILYLKFKGSGTANLFNLNWWKFNSSSGINTVSETMEACVSRISVVSGAGKTQMLRLEFSNSVAQGNLMVSLFDLNGRQIATLFNGQLSSSHLTLPLNRAGIGQGAYVIKVSLNNKMTLVKTAAL